MHLDFAFSFLGGTYLDTMTSLELRVLRVVIPINIKRPVIKITSTISPTIRTVSSEPVTACSFNGSLPSLTSGFSAEFTKPILSFLLLLILLSEFFDLLAAATSFLLSIADISVSVYTTKTMITKQVFTVFHCI